MIPSASLHLCITLYCVQITHTCYVLCVQIIDVVGQVFSFWPLL